jgi:DMSO/TMAO reductase YedYZ molybdopterin-dependent catalytic subunit
MGTATKRKDELIWLTRDPDVGEVPLATLAEPPVPGRPTFVRQHFPVPAMDTDGFRVTVGGAVGRTLSLGLGDLKGLPFVRRTHTLECAGNGRAWIRPLVPRVQWGLGGASVVEVGGTPLAPLLERAGPRASAREVVFTGADSGTVEGRVISYERSLPLDVALDPQVLLITEMNGEPLRPEQGAPLRLFVPGWYAMATVKWLTGITVIEEAFRGYYQVDDYVYHEADGSHVPVTTMRPRAVITSLADGDVVGPGPVAIEGIAWSGTGCVEHVRVSVDGGASWAAATLVDREGDAPRPWRFLWTAPTPGGHEIVARAGDASGNEQPLEASWNALGYGNNAVQRIRVSVGAAAARRS